MTATRTDLRNIAIIAHVDHGKTTLVDALLRQSGVFRDNQAVAERALDRNDLERERGITILAKCTSITWNGLAVNIVDTPGHADFGGEVERILHMVDGVLLLVDAAEGPMPQTKFVTQKALKLGLKPIVVVNKIDRPDGRPRDVESEVFDLFAALDASEEQLDFPTLFASGRDGWAATEPDGARDDLTPLFEAIRDHVPAPEADADAPAAMLAALLEADPFLGRILTGRIHSGVLKPNMTVRALNLDGQVVETARITKLMGFRGLERVPVDEARAGDIVAVAGLSKGTVAHTIADPAVTEGLAAQPVDPPTLAVTISINDSPLAGQDGKKLTSRVIRDRLLREAEGNVAIRVQETDDKDAFEVAGRGELQLGVLIEEMRREGFELSISRPRVLFQDGPDGDRLEPVEDVVVDVDEAYSGTVVEAMSERKAVLSGMESAGAGKTRLTFKAPARGLIGYHGLFLTQTRGTGVMTKIFSGYEPYKGAIAGRRNGVLISNVDGRAVAYTLAQLEDRGVLFVGNGDAVYNGMIVGENSREQDLEVNPTKTKQLTNIRAAGTDETIRLTPPRRMSLEAAIAYIADDERVEVTPSTIRLRKALLDPHARKKAGRTKAA
jgi:GTP-binding protein